MKNLTKELSLIIITLLPLGYLFYLWNDLPASIPTHFNFQGEADGWSNKEALPYMIGGLGIGIYLLMLLIPIIDPKKRIQEMGTKYFQFRFILALFFAGLNCFIIYSANIGNISENGYFFALLGGLFAALGNFFQTVRPNFFIGIRTPWTMQSEQVWKETHRIGGRLWMICGLLIIVIAFALPMSTLTGFLMIVILAIVSLVPIIHSYLLWKKEQKKGA